MAGDLLDKRSGVTGWGFAIIAFVVSLWAHWDHFSFIKEADFYEYERSNMTLIK